MLKEKFGERLAVAYGRFRNSWWFVILVLIWVAVWLFRHHFYHDDPHLAELNTQLSVEATVAGAVLSMMVAKGEGQRRKAAKRHDEMLHTLSRLAEQQARTLEYVADLMKALLEATREGE